MAEEPLISFLQSLRDHRHLLDAQMQRVTALLDHNILPENHGLWSEKECATTALVKLSQAQLKWVEMEWEATKALLAHSHGPTEKTDSDLLPEEMENFLRALRRMDEEKKEQQHPFIEEEEPLQAMAPIARISTTS